MDTIKLWLKKKHILPIYKVDLLKYARKRRGLGLCCTLSEAYEYYGIDIKHVIFPLFTHKNAQRFGGTMDGFWWPPGIWNTGRLDFLDWLIEQYKDDKKDLRELW